MRKQVNLSVEKRYVAAKSSLTQEEQLAVDHLEAELRRGLVQKGRHEERICHSTTNELYSYRVNQAIRLFVFKWRPTDYILVDVGHHDEVYKRVVRLRFGDHGPASLPSIEEPQTIDIVVKVNEPKVYIQSTWKGLSSIASSRLQSLGLSHQEIAELKSIRNEDAFEAFLGKRDYSNDIINALIDIADSPDRCDEIVASLHRHTAAEILEKDQDIKSRSHYFYLSDELSNRYYSGNLENWQVYLHPSQQKVVEAEVSGPIMVKGPAGTGKTVVAVHRVRWLLEHVSGKILFTTYTRVLADDAKRMIKSLVDDDELLKRVEVRNIDEFIKSMLAEIHRGHDIVYDNDYPRAFTQLFADELERSGYSGRRTPEFLMQEFFDTILEHDINSAKKYVEFQRPRLSGVILKKEREQLWPIFTSFRTSVLPKLKTSACWPRVLAVDEVTKALRSRRGSWSDYWAVVVDEVQDLGASDFRLLAALTGNTFDHPIANRLFLAGDGHQRIYGRSGALKNCGINITNRSYKLKQCYRSTRLIREYAENVIRGVQVADPDGEVDLLAGGESLAEGEKPTEKFFQRGDYDAMNQAIAETVRGWMATGSKHYSDYAVLMRLRGIPGKAPECYLYNMAKALNALNIPAVHLSKKVPYSDENKVRVMTMHSAKGLQFLGVVVVTDHWPYRDKTDDEEQQGARLEQEKCLLYMSMMRAQSHLFLTGTRGRAPQELMKPTGSQLRERMPILDARLKMECSSGVKNAVISVQTSSKKGEVSSTAVSAPIDTILNTICKSFKFGIRLDDESERRQLGNEIGLKVTDLMLMQIKMRLFKKGDNKWYHPDSVMPKLYRTSFLSVYTRGPVANNNAEWMSEMKRGMSGFMTLSDIKNFAMFIKNGCRNAAQPTVTPKHSMGDAKSSENQVGLATSQQMTLCPICRKLYVTGIPHTCLGSGKHQVSKARKKRREAHGDASIGTYSILMEERRNELYPE